MKLDLRILEEGFEENGISILFSIHIAPLIQNHHHKTCPQHLFDVELDLVAGGFDTQWEE